MLSTIIKYLYLVALIAPMSILAMPITIIAPSKTFTLDVEPSDSIGTLRQLISNETSIPYDRVVIAQSVEGGTAVLDDDNPSLSDRNIQKDDTLTVSKSNAVPSFSGSEWEFVGSAKFAKSQFAKNYAKIKVDAYDIPWVIFVETSIVSVLKFNGIDWEQVGAGGIADGINISYTDITFDSNNAPFICFTDKVGSERFLRVLSFDGTKWNDVGSSVSAGYMSYNSLAFDNNGVLHIAYSDYNFEGKAVVKKYNGTNWVNVGTQGFTPSLATNIELVFDSSNTPHISFIDPSQASSEASVMKFNGSFWQYIDNTSLTIYPVISPSIVFDSDDNIFLSARNSSNRTVGLGVYKFDGTTWATLSENIIESEVGHSDLVLGKNDTPIIFFDDGGVEPRGGSVVSYQNDTWQFVGERGFAAGDTDKNQIVLDSQNTPYVIYSEGSSTSVSSVMKYATKSFSDSSLTINQGDSIGDPFEDMRVSDEDGDDVVLTITLSDTNAGSFSGNASGGADYNYEPSSGVLTVSGSVSDVKATIKNLTFTLDSNYTGEFTFTNELTDGTESASPVTLTYNVVTPNKAPSVSVNKGLSIDEGATTLISTLDLSASDPDDTGAELTFTLKSVPTNGSLFVDANDNGSLDSGEALAVNGTFTQQTLDDSNLYYKHNGSETTSDNFTFDLADGLEDGVEPVTNQNFTISVSLTNDAPVMVTKPKWDFAGNTGFSIAAAFSVSLELDSHDIPYVAFTDRFNDRNVLSGMKLEGDSWQYVGPERFHTGITSGLKMAIDSHNVPHIIYSDISLGGKAVVQKFINGSWQTIGGGPVNLDETNYLSIAIDSADNLYVAYQDSRYFNKAIVKKWDGTNWQTVGGMNVTPRDARFISLAFDDNDTPFLAYVDKRNDKWFGNVKKFVNDSWVPVGPVDSLENVYSSNFALNNNTPYFVNANSSEIFVRKFDGTDWVLVGERGFSAENKYTPDIEFDSNNRPHVAYTNRTYKNGTEGFEVRVTSFDGTSWQTVSPLGVRSGKAYQYGFAIASDDSLYISFNDSADDYKASVLKSSRAVFDSYALSVAEDSDASLLFDNYQITDEEGDDVTLTITLANNTSGLLAGAASGSAVVNYNNDNATLTVSGSLADVTTTLANLSFKPAANFSGSLGIDWMVFNRSTGVLTGTPTNDDVGVHSVTLTVTDSANATIEQTFTITVENVNDVPDVQNDIASVDEDNSVAIDILANDSDVDSKLNPASVMIVTTPTQGQTSLNTANGVITYTPNENINGTDTFSYTVDDIEHGRSDVATVTITINPVNDAPLANSDSAMTEEDMAIEIDVALNDADIDEGDSLDLSSLVVVSAPENGQANVQNDRIVYTPASNFNGSDTFTYRIADKAGAVSNIARVLVTIGEVNDAPVATNDLGVLDEDTSIELSILDNDIDVDSELITENVTITKAPKHGELTVNKELSTIRFTPHSDFFGTDSFEYSVKDDQSLMSNIATVTLTVNSVNDAPVAQNDTAVLLEDTSHNINVLGNDSDVDGTLDKTSLEVVTQPEHGNVQVNNGVFSYTPDINSYGADTFTYRVKDDLGLWSNHAEVFITVTAVNDAPLANNDVIQTNEDESVIIDVTQNDSDIDGHLDEDSVNIVTNPAFGHITNNVDGTVTYTPISNYVGFDSFTYSVLDNEGAQSNTASVTITVLAVNDAPVIESHPVTSATQDEAYSYVVTVKDIDSADSYKLSALELPSWLDFDPTTGELSGTPSNDDVGTHSINLVATDAGGLTDTQTFAITVADVNDEATGGISITGEAKEGETLAVESTIEDPDGVGEFTYQWMRNGEIITGATLAEYMLTEADIGATITVVVTYVDGHGNTETFTSDATSVVIIANVAPVTHDEQFSMDEDESITFSLNYFDENGDELTLNLVTPVSNGTLLMDANHLVYQANADFNGTDSFSYTVSDGMLNSNIATVTIVVNAINDAPVSMPDNFTVNADLNEYVVLDVLANDIDVDGDELTLVKATVSAGTIRIVDNKLEYLAPVGLNADVVITYQIKDSNGEVVEVTLVVSVVSTAAEITITAPEDKTIASKGLFTKVNMGTAIAKDALGNPVRVTASSKGFFAPGTHTVIWSAGEGNDQVSATQLINVIPQVNFSKNQTATEGTAVSIKAILNGDAVNYPVVVPYTVSGDALEGADHDLVEGEFRFEKGQREASLIVNVSSDDIDEKSETLVLQFSTPENAVVGPLGEHTLTIEEGNVAPSIEVFANQQGIVTRIINRQGGDVTLTTLVTDANLTDTHIYGWLTSDSAIVDTDSVEESFTFDPQLLELGTYQFEVGVFDGQQAGSSLLELTIVDSMPQLSSEDTDFDGIPDNEEGYGDADNDGIPDYLDADSLALNVVQEKLNESEFFLMETEPGLQLSLGHVAFVAHGTNTGVSEQEVMHYGNYGSGATADAGFDYASGVFDFNVSQIPVAGQSVGIVIAQFAPIPSNAVYRKLMHTGWTEFVVDSRNSIASAPGAEGFCPPPHDAQYTQGLTEGHWCVQLTIEDGGPNDADGKVNRIIEDPSGIASTMSTNTQPVAEDDMVRVKRNISTYLDVLSNDTDANDDSLILTSAAVDIGEVSIVNNLLYFVPQAEHLGIATISYSISDSQGGADFATVIVDVVANEAPMIDAIIDVSTDDQSPVTIDILANVTDEDNNDFTIISATAENGSVVINDDGTITYTPNAGFEGTDTVTFVISDGDGGTTQGQFNVVVKAYKQVSVEHKTSGGGTLPMSLILLLFALTMIRRSYYRTYR